MKAKAMNSEGHVDASSTLSKTKQTTELDI